jgi:hypothetical protein
VQHILFGLLPYRFKFQFDPGFGWNISLLARAVTDLDPFLTLFLIT